jgi:hypothetical protein
VYGKQIKPLLATYCSRCHGPQQAEGEIALHEYVNVAAIRRDRETWKRIAEMIEFDAMPPEDEPQPSSAERQRLLVWINDIIRQEGMRDGDPGRVTLRRLNRAEYDNTVRDLTGLELHLSDDFPSDDVGEGFDNIGDVLSLPPLLFERYMDAAEHIAGAAILDSKGNVKTKRCERDKLKGFGSANLDSYGVYRLSSSGLVTATFEFPRDGEYLLRGEAGAQQAGSELAKMEISLDGKAVKVVDVKAPMDQMDLYEAKVRVPQGAHRVSAAFINDYYNPEARDPSQRDRNMAIRALEVVGPVDLRAEELPASHRRIMIAVPGNGKTAQQAAREILDRFASRAFRRPVTDSEMERLLQLVDKVLERDESFERAIQVAVASVLVSPHFLFRVELDPEPDNPNRTRTLNDYELASRLSYFLWSSMPDDPLFDLAAKGRLQDDQVLRQQVLRMLQDDKAAALVTNFGGQWLNLRNLEGVTPDPEQFVSFNDRLRRDMQGETERLFATIMREDRSIIDFLTADFTFVNQRLAEHYGLPGIQGEQLQRVSLDNGQRIGVLTHGSILTLTSNPTRTSPVKRGKWIMENILGTPPPDPPGNVPPLEEAREASPNATLREQMVMHRDNPVCASCHRQMDPLGFGFENFDAVGRWRERDGDHPIDSSGELPSGEKFSGPTQLVRILSQRQELFSRMLAGKVLTYALGRGLQPYDESAIDEVVQRLKQNEYRFSQLVTGIALSDPFRMRRGDGGRQ